MRKVTFCLLSAAHVHAASYIRCLKRNPMAEVVGFYDADAGRARAFAAAEGIASYPSASRLLETRPDVAIVCSENTRHAHWVGLAARAGVDVLCEKPLGTDPGEMRGMIDACRAAGVRLMTAMCNRYPHSFADAVRAVRSGRIGEVAAVFATNKGTMPGGWFTDRELSGGGCIVDHTVHVADLMNVFFGAAPEEVYARAGHNLFGMDVEDCAVVTLRYPGGALVTLDASWSRSEFFPYGRDLTLHFVGTRGSVRVDYFAESHSLYAKGRRACDYYGEDKDQMMMDDLVACRLEGREFGITGEDGMRCALVAEAAYRSLREGVPVALRT